MKFFTVLAVIVLAFLAVAICHHDHDSTPALVAQVDTLQIKTTVYDTLVVMPPDLEARFQAIEALIPKCRNLIINKASWTCIEPR